MEEAECVQLDQNVCALTNVLVSRNMESNVSFALHPSTSWVSFLCDACHSKHSQRSVWFSGFWSHSLCWSGSQTFFHNYSFVSLWWLTSVLYTIMNTQQHKCPHWSVRRPFVLPELCCVLRPHPSLIDTRHVLDPAASIFTQWFSLWPPSWLQANAPVTTP